MTSPLISVLLPVFNAADALAGCLDSILAQQMEDFELVVVDDGSTDESCLIVESAMAADRRIRLLKCTHRGIVAALNAGIDAAAGRYIARMDADDRMAPERLAKQLAMAAQLPAEFVLGTRVALDFPDGDSNPKSESYVRWSNTLVNHDDIVRSIYIDAPLVHPTYFLPRDFYLRLGQYRQLGWAEDYDLLLRALRRGARFAKCPEILVRKRETSASLSRYDRRYGRMAMLQAKVHHFARSGLAELAHRIVLIGSGRAGRSIARFLQSEGIEPQGFIDNKQGPPGRRVMDLPAYGLDTAGDDSVLRSFPDPIFVLSIGNPTEARKMELRLESEGFRAGSDFFRFL